jgi:putative ABC transport system permease protein
MRLWGYTTRELGRRPGRTFLTFLGIVIGVATVVSVSLTTESARGAFEDMFAAVGGDTALEVVAEGEGGFPVSPLAEELAGVDGVDAVVPLVQSRVVLLEGDGRTTLLVLGVDPRVDEQAREYALESGALLASAADPGVLLEEGFARSLGVDVGSSLRLLTPAGPREAVVAGLLAPGGVAIFNGGAVAVIGLEQAGRWFGMEGEVNSLGLVLSAAADQAAVEEAVGDALPVGFAVRTPASRGEVARDTLLSTENGLSSLSALALVAGGFIILNAFLMTLGERRRELAMLRALGVTRRQLTRLLLREAVLLGGAGTVVGLVVGVALAAVMLVAMEGLVGADLPGLSITAQPFVLGLVLGPVLSLVATYVPARRAGRIAPLEGLAPGGAVEEAQGRQWPAWVGAGIVVVSVGLAATLIAGYLPPGAASLIFGLLIVGCVLSIPLILGPVSAAVGWVIVPLLGTPGRLAMRQLERHRQRTALTVGVLFVAIAVGISMGGSILNNVRDVGDWYERVIVGDFFVRGAMPDTAVNQAASMPEAVGEEISALPGVERVDRFRFVPAQADGRAVVVLARTFATDQPLPLDLAEGDADEVRDALLRGEVVVGTGLVVRTGLGVGDTLTLETRVGPRELKIAGTATEYTAGGSALYIEWGLARELLDVEGADVFLVQAAPGREPAVGAALDSMADRDGLMIQSLADFRVFVDEMIGGVMGFLWLLLVLLFVVASLGVVNTLSMNVLEQTREIGLLRAVALTRRQVRRTVLSQALAVGAMSAVPGVVAGIGVAYLLNRGTASVIGHPVAFRVDHMVVVGSVVVAVIFAVAAAYVPARRAARLRLVEALQYE